jgi:hypothetical protein
VDGRQVDSEQQPAPPLAWIGTEPESRPPSRQAGRRLWIVAGLAAVLILGATAAWDFVRESDWPSGCDVSGHPDWCAEPSDAITDPALVALAHDYCPALSSSARADLVPQPLSVLGLADERTFARTSGDSRTGAEDAVLGGTGAVAWVTRWQDGLLEVRCSGSSATTPSLRLQADQFASTATADMDAGMRLDFADVARDLTTSMYAEPPTYISYGFLSCDTGGIDPGAPAIGSTFTCAVEVFRLQGQGTYRASYRVIDQPPYFVRQS